MMLIMIKIIKKINKELKPLNWIVIKLFKGIANAPIIDETAVT